MNIKIEIGDAKSTGVDRWWQRVVSCLRRNWFTLILAVDLGFAIFNKPDRFYAVGGWFVAICLWISLRDGGENQ